MTLERIFRRRGPKRVKTDDLPDLWSKCPACNAMVYNKDLDENWGVCPHCGAHQRLSARRRVAQLADEGTFQEASGRVRPQDPLAFVDTEPYPARLERARVKTGRENAILAGRASLNSLPVMLIVMDFEFSGGSLGSAEGEEITRAVETAVEQALPVVLVAASGGARMQESALSLMQMAKTTFAFQALSREGLPYISVLTDPTTGGVTASFATIADLILAEPGALIGFAGQRVILQTIKQNLPEGFQRAEFLQAHGMIDQVVDRRELKTRIFELLSLLTKATVA